MTVKKSSGIQKVSTNKNDVQDVVNKTITGDATIFIGESRVKSDVAFVMMFTSNLDAAIKFNKLQMTDIRILLAVLNKMNYGNQLSIKQASIATELGLDKSNVSKSWTKLKNSGIFLTDSFGNEFVNFDLFLKGKGKHVGEQFEEQADLSHKTMVKLNIPTRRPFRKIKKVLTPSIPPVRKSVKTPRKKQFAKQTANGGTVA